MEAADKYFKNSYYKYVEYAEGFKGKHEYREKWRI